MCQQYSLVAKQSEISSKTVPVVGGSRSSKNQIQGKNLQAKESNNEKDKYESVRKCIFQFYRDRGDLNVLNDQSNAEVKQFLKRLNKSNGEMWQTHTKKTSVVKLERIIN
ncbi:hypothetical protein RI129_010869 [Pyrocoelia pectoralis]|uniref:Uncharacterized protein n=1 Tax=Pyrocoelia pectoralis TaxID=417401 RepID=A0AAN7ZIB1_9COLE